MELWNILRSRMGQVDWRRHAPVAGSVVAHGVVVAAVAAVMAASARPALKRVEPPPLEVALVIAEPPPVEPEVRPAPARRAPVTTPQPSTDTAPPLAPQRRKEEKAAAPKPSEPVDSESVYVPPSPFATYGPTGGLQGLASLDPCATTKYGPRPRDCSQLGTQVGSLESAMPRDEKQLAQHFDAYVPKCRFRVGCDDGEWVSTNGTRNTAGTRMAGGVSSVGGITDTVGRLDFNPDHRDTGFGN